jgi:drug/metabolite transporter (DMT)-like permease
MIMRGVIVKINDKYINIKQAWGYVVYAGVLASGIAMLLQMYGQSLVHPTVSGLLLTLESFFGALTAVLFLHETLTTKLIIGGGLLMLAVVMVEIGPKLFKPKAILKEMPVSEAA